MYFPALQTVLIGQQGGFLPGGYSSVWPTQGCTFGQGMVFDLSVLNRVYNIVSVCPKGET